MADETKPSKLGQIQALVRPRLFAATSAGPAPKPSQVARREPRRVVVETPRPKLVEPLTRPVIQSGARRGDQELVGVWFKPELLAALDAHRGDLTRQDAIRAILAKALA